MQPSQQVKYAHISALHLKFKPIVPQAVVSESRQKQLDNWESASWQLNTPRCCDAWPKAGQQRCDNPLRSLWTTHQTEQSKAGYIIMFSASIGSFVSFRVMRTPYSLLKSMGYSSISMTSRTIFDRVLVKGYHVFKPDLILIGLCIFQLT